MSFKPWGDIEPIIAFTDYGVGFLERVRNHKKLKPTKVIEVASFISLFGYY